MKIMCGFILSARIRVILSWECKGSLKYISSMTHLIQQILLKEMLLLKVMLLKVILLKLMLLKSLLLQSMLLKVMLLKLMLLKLMLLKVMDSSDKFQTGSNAQVEIVKGR